MNGEELSHLFHSVETKMARMRALTQDVYAFHLLVVSVETKMARMRALTPFLKGLKPSRIIRGRNEDGSNESIDTL